MAVTRASDRQLHWRVPTKQRAPCDSSSCDNRASPAACEHLNLRGHTPESWHAAPYQVGFVEYDHADQALAAD